MGKSSIWSLLLVVTIHGVWSEIRLEQSPSEVKRPGETVKMSCIISGYSMTSSYPLDPTETRESSGVDWVDDTGSNSASYASSFQSRFSMTEDVPSSTQFLQIQTLTAADSAVYFCARDDTVSEDSGAAAQKPPQRISSVISIISVFSYHHTKSY
uniref:Ig-like domain-containing protein n=1 Tax=Labrus bergylta TaxID=56723 RepID=A0A3Q3ETW1_9LABR